MLSRFERHQAASYGAAAVPSKTMCRQTLTTPDGPERHRRFYLAVVVGRDPSSRWVMSATVDRGREGELGNIDANDQSGHACPILLVSNERANVQGLWCSTNAINLLFGRDQ